MGMEVVRQFRVWRREHRPLKTAEGLAKELGIPEKVVSKMLMGVDPAQAYQQRITAFLEAFATGETEQMSEIAQASEELPRPHTLKAYAPAVMAALKQRQLQQVEDDDRPHCLIARQEVAPRQCIMAQNSAECIGCTADTKFCLECGFDRVAFAGSDLCAYCLTLALNDPNTDRLTSALPIKVVCLQSGGQRISVSVCHRLQGQACSNCNAATRICQDCKKKRVRYASFGACLACYTELMAPASWQKFSPAMMESMCTQREEFFARVEEASRKRKKKEVAEVVTPTLVMVAAPEAKITPAPKIVLPQMPPHIHRLAKVRLQRLATMSGELPEACEEYVDYKKWRHTFVGEGKQFPTRAALDQFLNKAQKDGLIDFRDPRYWGAYNHLRFNVQNIQAAAVAPKKQRDSRDSLNFVGKTVSFEALMDTNKKLKARVKKLEQENADLRLLCKTQT